MTDFVRDAGRLNACVSAMEEGSLSAVLLVERCLDRIAEIDGEIKAWIHICADQALATARGLDEERASGCIRGPLHGIPFAVKDVIDVAGLPTRANSRSRADAMPATADATVVAHLRAAGAIVLGKVHTTEFAYFESVPPTRNPHDRTRTPGGSSAGSAAAVASGMVPLALGTQTAGSVNRPAAYCGIGAFKPSTLSIAGTGVFPLAPSFDTMGGFAATAADAATLVAAFAADHLGFAAVRRQPLPRIVVVEDPLIARLAAPICAARMTDLAARFKDAGVAVVSIAAPVALDQIVAAHRIVLLAELGRTHAKVQRDLLAPRLSADIETGLAIPERAYHAALLELAEWRRLFWAAVEEGDLLLMPAAPDIAPADGSTGDPRFVVPATALGGPIAGVRANTPAKKGLPIGAMLTAAPGADARLAHFLWSPVGRELDL
jgi:aspartyl-tRNA(Asn)/glutamyl-tRNA(Gln) amidotransferase subunit A